MSDDQLQNIKNLLKDVGAKVEKSKEIARLKGENFNIFSILGLETKENKTHSNFLASLLNPKGEHSLGDTFLRLFFDTVIPIVSSEKDEKQEIVKKLRNETVIVKTEDTEGIEDGRVDISIKGISGIIFIENKIYAGDQTHQIAKYIKAHKEINKIVFYLTLDEHLPSENSTKSKDGSEDAKVNKDFFLLSYKTDIKNWLEKCQKEASDYPIIRETIKQYLILIKKLTGQLTSNEMEKEIQKAILKNLDAANAISDNIEKAKAYVNVQFYNYLIKRLKNENKWEIKPSDTNKGHLLIFIRESVWNKDLKYLFQINPKGGQSYFTVVLKNMKNLSDPSFIEQIRKLLGIDYYHLNDRIARKIEMHRKTELFISEFYTKTDEEKDLFIETKIIPKIFKYIDELNEKVNKVNDLLKEYDNNIEITNK